MIVHARNYNPALEGEEKTYLTDAVAAAATLSKVQNNKSFATNDFVVLGEIGNENTEIVKASGVTGNQQVDHSTVTPKFPHPAQTPVYRTKWDKVEFWRASSKTGSYSLATTLDLDVANREGLTNYDDTSGIATDWGKIRFKNSHTTTYSEYSQPFPYAGFTPYAATLLIDEIVYLWSIQDPTGRYYDRQKILMLLNEGVDKTQLRLIRHGLSYFRKECTPAMDLTTSNEYDWLTNYTDVRPLIESIHIKYDGTNFRKAYPKHEIPSPDEVFGELNPRYQQVGGKLRIMPTPLTAVTAGLKVFAHRLPILMDDETDEPDLPRGSGNVLIPYTLMRLNQLKDKTQKALDYQKEWSDAVDDVVAVYQNDQTDQPRYVHYVE